MHLLLLAVNSSIGDRLTILVIMGLFSAVVYMILPKLMDKRLRAYHEQVEAEEDEIEQEINNEIKELMDEESDKENQGAEK